MELEFARVTFRIAMSRTTGAEMVVMRRRMKAMKRKMTPSQWRGDVWAMVRNERGRGLSEVRVGLHVREGCYFRESCG